MNTLHKIGLITFQQNYSSNPLKGLRLVPTQETQLLIKTGAIVLYQFEGTIEVYCRNHIKDNEIISFWVEVEDALFYNYTSLPKILPKENSILYFGPSENTKGTAFGTPIPVLSKMHKFQLEEASQEDVTITFTDLHGEVANETIIEKDSDNCIVNFSYENDGVYHRTYNDAQQNVLLTDKNLVSVIGICSFPISIANTQQIDIKFQSTETQWEYLIITKENKPSHNYSIVDGTGSITFSYQGLVTITSNVEALCFLSDQKIEFKEYPETKIKLIRSAEGSNAFMQEMEYQLPYPHPENLKKLQKDKGFKTQTICYI